MKRSIAVVLVLLIATPAAAGISYRFRSVSAGITSTSLAGTVRSERGTTRADLSEGDGLTFRRGSFVISRPGVSALVVGDAGRKSWYELELAAVIGDGSVLGSLGALADMRVENERVSVTPRGAGPRLAGYPTVRTTIETSYDVVVAGTRARVSSTADSWTTPALPADSMSVFQMKGARTGIAAVDRLLDLQVRGAHGFPLRQVTIVRVSFGERQWVSKTTTTVSDVRKRAVTPEELRVPRDYRKVASPFGRK